MAPVNVGIRSMPDYASIAAAAVRQLPNNSQVFAGQRDEGFYVNLGVFDLLGVPPADNNTPDSTAGFNVHSIAIEVPISTLTNSGSRPASATAAVRSSACGPRRAGRRSPRGAAGREALEPIRPGVAAGPTARQRGRDPAPRSRTRSTRSSRRRMRRR